MLNDIGGEKKTQTKELVKDNDGLSKIVITTVNTKDQLERRMRTKT